MKRTLLLLFSLSPSENHADYQKSFNRLLRDLEAEEQQVKQEKEITLALTL